ncbi:MAG TPA: MFS transporter, partial [Dehalococcoidia bacterium]|nr:MFS transporter [Dehalococcoidia bacterium]
MTAEPRPPLSTRMKMLVVFVLYFAEGVPFGFVYTTLSFFLRTQGVPLEQIGILSLLGLAWSLKVLWSPLADRFGSRAAWLVPAQAVIVLAMLGLAYLADSPVALPFWVLVGLLCLASATQDLAVDAYTIDLLDTSELGLANGIRIGAYRVGLIASGGGVLILSDLLGWSPTFVGVGIIMAALALTVLAFGPFHLPRPEVARHNPATGGFAQIKESVKGLMGHPNMGVIILFILTYKAGDALLGAMVSPFWRDLGYSGTQFGVASITVGKLPAILGGFLGGLLTARWGISRALWLLGVFQALSILGYWVAALPGAWYGTIYLATLGESLAGQMGSAAFMAFL